ncbi:MAG: hypothetical protein K0U45_04290 [Alphaproteobacteria bacterium]|nr:hypothetical protein [Alphaproteobacteria bacterium]
MSNDLKARARIGGANVHATIMMLTNGGADKKILFSRGCLMALGTVSAGDVDEYLPRYVKAGLLRKLGFYGANKRVIFGISNQFPTDEAPMLTRDGKPALNKQAHQQIWVAVRKLKKFTLAELLASIDGVPKTTIKKFLQRLKQWGLVEFNGKWVLKRDIGPLAPQQSQNKGYDPNSDKEIS